jgi:hypothetical protein
VIVDMAGNPEIVALVHTHFGESLKYSCSKEWGRAELNNRLETALTIFIEGSKQWLRIDHLHGTKAVSDTYSQLVTGKMSPEIGNILSF